MARQVIVNGFPPAWVAETQNIDVALTGGGWVVEAAGVPTSVTPGAGSVVFTGFAPSVSLGLTVSPGAGSVVFTGETPTLTLGLTLAPGAGAVTITGKTPSLTLGLTIVLGAGSVVLTGYAPAISGITPPAPPPPTPTIVPTGAFDAGPGFGSWYNLAFKGGGKSRKRRRRETDLGRDLALIAYADAANVSRGTLPPDVAKKADEIVEQAVAVLERANPPDEAAALKRIAAHEIAYARTVGLTREDAREMFLSAVVERAQREHIQAFADEHRRRIERDDLEVLMLMELGL